MMYEDLFYKRLSELRNQIPVSAREMSLAIGQNENYINLIENGRTFPSMSGFFYICEYLKIHPKDFFNDNIKNPKLYGEIEEHLQKLTSKQMEYLLPLLSDITKSNRTPFEK
ncbi:MAG TPA: helix-turn-helix transcriptional regulator [Candidatus Coprocola pullicola]|nr:helix-turn-helix transcriptional regulator [Candidatus Coprocola pullicola]